MNKKKFFATCTLVAFGATMVPAMAFGAVTAYNGTSFNDFKTAVEGAGGLVIEFTENETWLTPDDTLTVKLLDGNQDVSSNFIIDSAIPGAADSSTNGSVVIKPKKEGLLTPGYYMVTVTDADPNAATKKSKTSEPLKATLEPLSVSATATVNKTTGVITGALNEVTITNSSQGYVVFDLGENGFAQIKKGDKALSHDVAGTPTNYAVSASKTLPVECLTAGHTYALEAAANATASENKYPTAYFTYTQEVADAVAKVVEEAEKQVNADLAKIPAEITVEVSGSTAIALNDATAQLGKTTLGLSGNNKVFIDSGSMHVTKDDYTLATDTYADAAGKNINPVTVAAAIEDNDGKDLEETITVVIQNDDTKAISNMKTVKVILTGEKTDSEKMAAYAAKYLQNYNAGKKSDTSDDTASLVVTKTGKAFSTDYGATFAIVDGGRDFVKCFNDNNIESLPEKDLTGKVGVSIGGGTITVDTTIKADGSVDPTPSDKEEAKKVFEAKSLTFQEVAEAAMKDEKITTVELADVFKAYNEMMNAYQAYKKANA